MRNPFKQLIDLLPQYPLQIGTVTAAADGIVTLVLPDGGVMTARGDAGVGDKVFFRNGVVEGTAPDLSVEVIDV